MTPASTAPPQPTATPCPVTSGNVETIEIESTAAAETIALNVYTPPCYSADSQPLPVLYLLHGGGINFNVWTRMGTDTTADELISEGTIQPLVIVMPPSLDFGPTFEAVLFADIMPHIESSYRVIANRDNRGLAGMSLGGGMTVYVGFDNTDTFGALGVLALAYVYDLHSTMQARVDRLAASDVPALYLDVGADDSLVRTHRALRDQLDSYNIDHVYIERDGGDHTLPYWTRTMPFYLIWFDSQFTHTE